MERDISLYPASDGKAGARFSGWYKNGTRFFRMYTPTATSLYRLERTLQGKKLLPTFFTTWNRGPVITFEANKK